MGDRAFQLGRGQAMEGEVGKGLNKGRDASCTRTSSTQACKHYILQTYILPLPPPVLLELESCKNPGENQWVLQWDLLSISSRPSLPLEWECPARCCYFGSTEHVDFTNSQLKGICLRMNGPLSLIRMCLRCYLHETLGLTSALELK